MTQCNANQIETIQLVIIADDFTGALDTGIQFAESGAATVTLTQVDDWSTEIFHTSCEVLVIDAETRHLERRDAYRIVYEIVRKCMMAGIPYIYKKIDSALRGNIGAELKAAIDASGSRVLPLVPSYPQMNRCTVEGVHYVDGIPVTATAIGQDPFDPVESSRVADLFLTENVFVRDRTRFTDKIEKCPVPQIVIYDAQSMEELDTIAEEMVNKQEIRVMAGCAGFAAALSKAFHFEKSIRAPGSFPEHLLILCGSVNETSRKQLAYEEQKGTIHLTLNSKQQEQLGYLESKEGKTWLKQITQQLRRNKILMIDTQTEHMAENEDTVEEKRNVIAKRLGRIGREMVKSCQDTVVMAIGGDTLFGFLQMMNCRQIIPVQELEAGTVLSCIMDNGREMWIISKSGGFGDAALVSNVIDKIGLERGGK